MLTAQRRAVDPAASLPPGPKERVHARAAEPHGLGAMRPGRAPLTEPC